MVQVIGDLERITIRIRLKPNLPPQASRLLSGYEKQPGGVGQPCRRLKDAGEWKALHQLAFRRDHENGRKSVMFLFKSAHRDQVRSRPGGVAEQAGDSGLALEDDLLAASVGIRNQYLIRLLVLNRAPIDDSLAVRGECHIADYVTHDLPRRPAQCGNGIDICAVSISRVRMRVVKIVAIRRESGAVTEEPGLWRHDGDLAACGHLLNAQAAFAFPPAISHQS